MSSTKFVFFRPIRKTRWPPWPLIGWDIFDFSSETVDRNSMKLDRKQDLNVLYQVCVFRTDRKNKMAVLASDWLRHFQLLLWNCWTEFNETWQEERYQFPLPSLFFLGPIGKTRWPPWPIRQKGGTLYSGARYVALWASCLFAPISSHDIYCLMLSSVLECWVRFHILSFRFTLCEDSANEGQVNVNYHLILRKWVSLNPGYEFRCFVRNNNLIGKFYSPVQTSNWYDLYKDILSCQ